MYNPEKTPTDIRQQPTKLPFPLNVIAKEIPPSWEKKTTEEINNTIGEWGNDFLAKQNLAPEEKEYLQKFLSKTPSAQQNEYHLIMDKYTNQITKQGKASEVTKKKYDLICLWIEFVKNNINNIWQKETDEYLANRNREINMKKTYEPTPQHELNKKEDEI